MTIEVGVHIGVLLVDDLNPEHAEVSGGYAELYGQLLDKPGVTVDFHSAHLGVLPNRVTDADAWLIGGSRKSVYDDDPWIADLRTFILDAYAADVGLVGICFGHQLIADTLGGAAGPAEVGWNVGVVPYRRADGSVLHLAASHRDQVSKLPPGAVVTLTSDRCPLAGFVIGDQVVSIQPHPEFNGELAAAIYESRRPILGDDAADRAISSVIGTGLDRGIVGEELVDFVRRHASARRGLRLARH